jgi:TubC N-terminal docking domain
MSAPGLLAELRARGFVLAAAGDRLRIDAPADVLTPELRDRLAADKPRLLAELASEAAWAEVERIADAGNRKASAALALDAAGARDEAERLRAEVCEMVTLDCLPAMRRWARSADRAGQLPEADRFLLDDPDVEAAAGGWRRVPGGWQETEERARRCVVHADRRLAEGDRLYCPECRAEADAKGDEGTAPDVRAPSGGAAPGSADPTAPLPWRCICTDTRRQRRQEWGDWVCAQCGLIVPGPEERP